MKPARRSTRPAELSDEELANMGLRRATAPRPPARASGGVTALARAVGESTQNPLRVLRSKRRPT